MALTDIETIYQKAVDLIGEIALTDTSNQDIKPYFTCATHYDDARLETIRGYAWNEAIKYALCIEDSVKPLYKWSYRYNIPTDCLRPLFTNRPRAEWRPVSTYIYTDYRISAESYVVGTDFYAGRYLEYGDITYRIITDFTATSWDSDLLNYLNTTGGDYGFIELEYVKDLANPNDWSAQLKQAIVLNLASKIVIPITGDLERRSALLKEYYQLVIPHAQALDAMQGTPRQFFYSEWLDARGQL